MGKKVKSARGQLVDFDLLKLKEQMASKPASTNVRARQDFIEKRLRRRLKKVSAPAPKIKDEQKEEADVTLEQTSDVEQQKLDVKDHETKSPKQKARPPKNTDITENDNEE